MPHKNIKGVPSVTQILDVIRKPYLEYWRGKYGNTKCEKIKKQSQNVGTRVHTEIERLLKGLKPKTKRQDIRQMVSNFNERFIKPYKVRPLVTEPAEPLIDPVNNFQGTFDAVIEFSINDSGKRICIADWKTSNQIDNTWPLQLSAYAHLWNTEIALTDDKAEINEGLVIRLDKKTLEIEGPIWYTNLDQYFNIFLSCRRLYDYLHREGLWRG